MIVYNMMVYKETRYNKYFLWNTEFGEIAEIDQVYHYETLEELLIDFLTTDPSKIEWTNPATNWIKRYKLEVVLEFNSIEELKEQFQEYSI